MILPILGRMAIQDHIAGQRMQMSSKWLPVGMSGSSPLSGVVVCVNSGVWSHLGITGTGKVSWSFQCWVPHSMVASTSAANFWAWSPNTDRHLTASWSGLRVRKIMVARLLMYDWAFFTTSSFNFRNLDKLFEGAECPAPCTSFCAVLLGDRSGTSRSCCDGQTPGLWGSCLSRSLSPSRLQLFDLFLLLLHFWLLLRWRLFDLFLLLLHVRSSSDWQSTLVLERPQSRLWFCSAQPRPTSGAL